MLDNGLQRKLTGNSKMKRALTYDFDDPDSFFRISGQAQGADYTRFAFGNDDGDMLEVDVSALMGDVKTIDCLTCHPVEMPLAFPSLESLFKVRTFVFAPEFLNEDGSEYRDVFRVIFDRRKLCVLFTDNLDKITSYYAEDRIVYYLHRGFVVAIEIQNLTEKEYLTIKNKPRGWVTH